MSIIVESIENFCNSMLKDSEGMTTDFVGGYNSALGDVMLLIKAGKEFELMGETLAEKMNEHLKKGHDVEK